MFFDPLLTEIPFRKLEALKNGAFGKTTPNSACYFSEIFYQALDHVEANSTFQTCVISFVDDRGELQQQFLSGNSDCFYDGPNTLISFKIALFESDSVLSKLCPGTPVSLLVIDENERAKDCLQGKVLITGADGFVILKENQHVNAGFLGQHADQSFIWNETHHQFGRTTSLSNHDTQKLIFHASQLVVTMERERNSFQAPLLHIISDPVSMFGRSTENEVLVLEEINPEANSISLNVSVNRTICLAYLNYAEEKIIHARGSLRLKNTPLIDGSSIRRCRTWQIQVEDAHTYEMISKQLTQEGEQV